MPTQTYRFENTIELELPRHIAVEGPLGIGKTTLTERLADSLNAETLLEEPDENPFLERFYQDKDKNALPTQLYFLFQRIQQLEELRQGDIFQKVHISDFMIDKDPLFARVNLDEDEYRLYERIYKSVIIDLPKPDLVIYLQAPTETLYSRIRKRGNQIERFISLTYLKQLNEAYAQFFHYYNDAPLLIVNTARINLAQNEADYQNLLRYISQPHSGRHYYNPCVA